MDEDLEQLSKDGGASPLVNKFYRQNATTFKQDKLEFNVSILREVCILSEGDSFGELGLMSSKAKRAATIVCLNDSDFATLDRSSYN